MRRVVLLACLALAGCKKTPTAPSTLSRDEFAARVHTLLPAARYDAAKFALVDESDGGLGGEWLLGNLYAEYIAADAAAKDAFLQRLPDVFASMRHASGPQTFDEAKAHLLPVVREGLYFDAGLYEVADGPKDVEIHHRPLTPVFHMGIAIDSDASIAIVTSNDTSRWKQSFDQLMQLALANLQERSEEPYEEVKPGLFRSPWHDNYDTSRILLYDQLRALALKGAPVVLLPNRDSVLVAGDKDAPALLAMADLAEEIMKEPRAMNTSPMRLVGVRWSDYVPDVTPEVKTRYRALQLGAMKSLYDGQKEMLEEAATKRKEDIFVASYFLVSNKKDKELFSLSALTRGAWTLLPATERVMFIDAKEDLHDNTGTKPIGWAPWARVMKVFGAQMKPMGLSPERYRVEKFPTPEQLKALALTP